MGKLHRAYPNLLIGNLPFFILIGVSLSLIYNTLSVVTHSILWKIGGAFILFNLFVAIGKQIIWKFHHKANIVQYEVERQLTEQEMKANMKIGDKQADDIISKIFENKIKFPFPNYYGLIENEILKDDMNKILSEMKKVPSWVDKKKIPDSRKFYMDNIAMIFSGLSIGLVKSYTYPSEANVF